MPVPVEAFGWLPQLFVLCSEDLPLLSTRGTMQATTPWPYLEKTLFAKIVLTMWDFFARAETSLYDVDVLHVVCVLSRWHLLLHV
jgi:hypothetical protein